MLLAATLLDITVLAPDTFLLIILYYFLQHLSLLFFFN